MRIIMVVVLVLFILPYPGDEIPTINEDAQKVFKTEEDCRAYLKGNHMNEKELYRFMDREGKFGFYYCKKDFIPVRDQNE